MTHEDALDETDHAVLRQLTARGADLTQQREVHHFFVAEDAAALDAVADALPALGLDPADPAPGGDLVELRATQRIVLSLDALAAAKRQLTALAAEHGVEYAGWEAAVKH